MNNDINYSSKRQNNRTFTGLFLIGLGTIYLLRHMGIFFFPSWLFSWPTILILIGVLTGIKHNFRNSNSYILIFIGSIFLIAHMVCVSIFYFWPFIMIAIGVSMMLGHKGYWGHDRWERKQRESRLYDNDDHVNL